MEPSECRHEFAANDRHGGAPCRLCGAPICGAMALLKDKNLIACTLTKGHDGPHANPNFRGATPIVPRKSGAKK